MKPVRDAKAEAAAVKKYRAICSALPGVHERISWGWPNHLVGGKKGKMFAAYGTGHGGPHLCFRVADASSLEGDARFKPVSSIGAWSGYEGWWFYFFDWTKDDDWDRLKHLVEVSWELAFERLPKKVQEQVLPSAAAAPVSAGASSRSARRRPGARASGARRPSRSRSVRRSAARRR